MTWRRTCYGDDLVLAGPVQIQMELRFQHGTTADADECWMAARSGHFDEADRSEAEEFVTVLRLDRPVTPESNSQPAIEAGRTTLSGDPVNRSCGPRPKADI